VAHCSVTQVPVSPQSAFVVHSSTAVPGQPETPPCGVKHDDWGDPVDGFTVRQQICPPLQPEVAAQAAGPASGGLE
jgi:hypothetical protein